MNQQQIQEVLQDLNSIVIALGIIVGYVLFNLFIKPFLSK